MRVAAGLRVCGDSHWRRRERFGHKARSGRSPTAAMCDIALHSAHNQPCSSRPRNGVPQTCSPPARKVNTPHVTLPGPDRSLDLDRTFPPEHNKTSPFLLSYPEAHTTTMRKFIESQVKSKAELQAERETSRAEKAQAKADREALKAEKQREKGAPGSDPLEMC